MSSTPARAVNGKRCMVSSGHPLATIAALEVLREGGNAVDAAVAASAVCCVVLPHACGVGGDAFALGYEAREGRTWALNASGKAPLLATQYGFTGTIPEDAVVAATIPGIVSGWQELLERYGTRHLEELLQPALQHAEEGFVVDESFSSLVALNRSKLAKHDHSAAIFLSRSAAPVPGDTFQQPALARTLARIAARGPEEFYRGETAAAMVQFMEAVGGLIRGQDLANHSSVWQKPIGRSYCGFEILVAPPNSIAILLLVQLGLLSPASLRELGHNSAVYIDTVVRAKRRAFGKVLPLLAESDSMTIEGSEIVLDSFLGRLGREPLLSTNRPGAEVSDTTSIVVVDAQGNAISLIQSIFHYFGCGAIAGDTGVLLNSRMLGFSLEGNSPNSLRRGKRPAHTLSPALVLRDGKPFLVVNTPGAYAQTQTLCQVVNNVLVFEMELQQALEAPRWFDRLDNVLLAEKRISSVALKQLVELGYSIEVGESWDRATGGVEAVLVQNKGEQRVLYGASDPRRHGCALGW